MFTNSVGASPSVAGGTSPRMRFLTQVQLAAGGGLLALAFLGLGKVATGVELAAYADWTAAGLGMGVAFAALRGGAGRG